MPNIDPNQAPKEGPIQTVTLDPFFISKYEMTQGQWLRFTGTNPSFWNPRRHAFDGKKISLLNPVDTVSWDDCNVVLWRLGLVIPTEAQWEYSARAGTQTIWWTGNDKESLHGTVNLADSALKRNPGAGDLENYESWLDDGYITHAPVGNFRPNAFGLHDTGGNVAEWCRDVYEWYGRGFLKKNDGEQLGLSVRERTFRGGSFEDTAFRARSAFRYGADPDEKGPVGGVRPARVLMR